MLYKNLQALTASTILTLCPLAAFANAEVQPNELQPKDLVGMSLAELSNVEVTSVSKTPEKENEAAAAIYVITAEDIKNSGSTTIPDLLRMVPGLTVTQAGAHDWTVTSRGFNNQFSNKLLVLMDGRTMYSPLFSGVIWDTQDTMLEDIDRIEVIRGPGATLWGANAVNGVINIITKSAKDTQGGLAVATAGNEIKGIGSLRDGYKIGDDSYARMYVKESSYDSENSPTGGSAGDSWHKTQAGFRSDSKLSESDTLNVQGDIYHIGENVNYTIPNISASPTYAAAAEGATASGGNVMAKWVEQTSKDSQTSLQVYFDNTSYMTSFFNDKENTIDLDFQHVWTGWTGQEVVWGAGYRLVNSVNDPTSTQYALTPEDRYDNLFNAFLQDKFTLDPNDLFLTLGSKIEHNDYTGIEIEPSARLSWLPTSNQTVWGAVSRAVRTPSRYTSDGKLEYGILPPFSPLNPSPLPVLVESAGNPNLESEDLVAYELGYRIQPTKSSSIDVAAFYNDYSNLFLDTAITPTLVFPGPSSAIQPYETENTNAATSKGIEISAKWNPYEHWQLNAGASYIDLVFQNKAGGLNSNFQGKQPKEQYNIRSTYLFSNGITMTNALYYIDPLPGIGISGYERFDTKLSYEIAKGIEVSLVGQNLLDNEHQEFTPFLYKGAADVGRSVFASVAVKF